jgi:transcriptional regulator with XRE-family HTH domain
LSILRSIDLKLAERLRDPEFRREWFRAQLEASVPEMFRDLREFRRYTQQDLAARAGMQQSAISRFEKSSDANWNLETLQTLAEALDAQLIISVERGEEVIARYERLEPGGAPPKASVLDASGADAYTPPLPALGSRKPLLDVDPSPFRRRASRDLDQLHRATREKESGAWNC